MSDELTRAIAEALAEALPGYSIRGRGATSAEIAAALAPLIEARVREARADECETWAREFAAEVDWSSGRWDYGDNQAYESVARKLTERAEEVRRG